MVNKLMNEATVRAEKLDPLIRMLGYKHNTDLNVYREHHFAYPKVSLGRKGKSDSAIIGKPDYICQARGIANWVLEAKAEGSKLGAEEDAQAYTYAAHPEIRALYYCLSDGRDFLIYKTMSPPNSPPLLSVSLDDLDVACNALSAYLSEDALRTAAYKLGPKLIDRDYKVFDIIGGSANFNSVDWKVDCPADLREVAQNEINNQNHITKDTIYPILNGNFESKGGLLNLKIELGAHKQSDIELQKQMGLNLIKFQSIGSEITTDINNPNIFQTRQNAIIYPEYINSSNPKNNNSVVFPLDYLTVIDTFLYRNGNKILGKFKYTAESPFQWQGVEMKIGVSIEGTLELNISQQN